ncbi:MAG TPA: T9SS type A sorting domain-containing protein [Candidatus Krumholzibacteria bacterium]|nr:T9SS type A sorting domain-containing protein [Candidatus Krumholzibacteria bacterium]
MKRFTFGLTIAAIAVMAATAFASKPQVVIGPGLASAPRTPYCQLFNRVLDSDTTYVLTGLYYVQPGYNITIQPGTLILGDKTTSGTLIITRGAQIFAQGTLHQPIVFTSSQAPGNRNPGDWGGIILLGSAPVNKVEPVIEGGLIGGDCTGTVGTYGGADANDNSGVVSYVRIEFAGYRFQLNNEINGLTFGGVGAGTQIDHVQVSYSFDDSYECFGGTVNMKYMVAFGGTDDDFDTDFGYTGHVQFGFGLKDPDIWDDTGESNGFESDNDGSSTSTDNPHTHPIYSNITLVGPERTNADVPFPIGSHIQYEAVLRRSTQTSIYNSVAMGFPWGVSLRDATTQGFANSNVLQIRNFSTQGTLNPVGSSSVHDHAAWSSIETWLNTAGWGNLNTGGTIRQPDTIKLNDMSNLNAPDPRPMSDSELATAGVDFTNPALAGFDVTTYRGAFPPVGQASLNSLWTAYWTNFDPQNTDYSMGITLTGVSGPSMKPSLGQNHPNPFNPQTAIDYTVGAHGTVKLEVFNARGELVRTLVNGEKDAGNYTAHFNADGMASGVYFYRLIGPGINEYKKMVLLK